MGTLDVTLKFSDHVYESIDNHERFVFMFIDLSNAFDTVNSDVLLDKLNHYGVRGVANDWLTHFYPPLRFRN